MKILVTGGTGFLGTALCASLASAGNEVTVLNSKNCDLTQQDSLNRWSEVKFDKIFHLAAWTQAGDFCLRHPGEQWLVNQRMNTNVLTWWHEHQAQAKLIAIGTSCAYDPGLPLVEENYLKGSPIADLFVYAMTKRMVFTGLEAMNRQFGHRYLYVIPSTLYGPGYHTDGRQMHFIFDLIRKFLNGKHDQEPVALWGNGHQKRELIHVDDFVKILLKLDQSFENEIFNIGAGLEHSIRDFAALICKATGYDFEKVEFDETKYTGAKSKCLDISKLKLAIPGLELMPLQEGLEQTIRWFETVRSQIKRLP